MNSFNYNPGWTRADAISLCELVEDLCPKAGFHVALTGGLLYKLGNRKDCDILFYRIRQKEGDVEKLFRLLVKIGLRKKSGFGWCYKCEYGGRPVDCFFPEEDGGEYIPGK